MLTRWQAGYAPEYRPLAKGMHPDIHVLSMQCRDAVTDDVVLRLHNLGSTKHRIDLKVGEEGRVVWCVVDVCSALCGVWCVVCGV